MICAAILLGVLLSAMSLGSMRLYGLYLEHRLASVTKRIEAVSGKLASLEEYHAALLSPSRIYNYARTELNMVAASDVQTIKLDVPASYFDAGSSVASSAEGSRKFGGLLGFFTGIANAQN
jgi:hypothetical protein